MVDVLISTTTVPYKVHAILPAVYALLPPMDIDVTHIPGTSLEMKVNNPGAQFKGFKISKTGRGNEREVVWNGKQLGKGNYALAEKSFRTATMLATSEIISTDISWMNPWEYPYLENAVKAKLEISEKDLSINAISMGLSWKLNKIPDLDLRTAEDVSLVLDVTGVTDDVMGSNSRWGNFKIDRELKIKSTAGKISLDLTGKSNFIAGALASQSPITTEVKLAFDVDKADLDGKVKKVVGGKEYSIEFHPGLAMPTIKMGA